jgi:hypothetical protein
MLSLEQLHGMLAIQVHPFSLAKRAFVPIKPDPFHTLDDGLDGFIRRATLVGVLDPKDKRPLLLARKEPVEESSADSTNMEKSRRTWSESDTNLAHKRIDSSPKLIDLDIYTTL